jgi:hypothetical protein
VVVDCTNRGKAESGRRPLVLPLPFLVRLRPESADFYGDDKCGTPAGTPATQQGSSDCEAFRTGRRLIDIRTPRAGSEKSAPRETVPGTAPAPLAAVFVLDRTSGGIGNRRIEIERLRASASFVALLAHAYCFDPDAAERRTAMLENYLDIASRVPVFRLAFPHGLAQLPGVFDAVERILVPRADATRDGIEPGGRGIRDSHSLADPGHDANRGWDSLSRSTGRSERCVP